MGDRPFPFKPAGSSGTLFYCACVKEAHVRGALLGERAEPLAEEKLPFDPSGYSYTGGDVMVAGSAFAHRPAPSLFDRPCCTAIRLSVNVAPAASVLISDHACWSDGPSTRDTSGQQRKTFSDRVQSQPRMHCRACPMRRRECNGEGYVKQAILGENLYEKSHIDLAGDFAYAK